MMRFFILILSIFICNIAFAEHAVVMNKATGKIISSHRSPNPDTYRSAMEKDIQSWGMSLDDVEIKIISDEEFRQIRYDTVIKPIEDKAKEKKDKIEALKVKIKQDLGLTDEEINLLFKE